MPLCDRMLGGVESCPESERLRSFVKGTAAERRALIATNENGYFDSSALSDINSRLQTLVVPRLEQMPAQGGILGNMTTKDMALFIDCVLRYEVLLVLIQLRCSQSREKASYYLTHYEMSTDEKRRLIDNLRR